MKVLGSVIIPFVEQRRLAAGASSDLPRARLLPKMLAVAVVGDLMWVQEPWALVTSRRFGPQNIREAMVGPAGGDAYKTLSEHARAHLHQLRIQPMAPVSLARADSRCTLEIMGISDHAVRVLVHMQQIDAFRKAKAA